MAQVADSLSVVYTPLHGTGYRLVPEALRRMGRTKEDAVYIGDSEVDFATAKNSGLPCISVLWGFRTRAFLESVGADCFVENPSEILG